MEMTQKAFKINMNTQLLKATKQTFNCSVFIKSLIIELVSKLFNVI